jgi:hypothetical protein
LSRHYRASIQFILVVAMLTTAIAEYGCHTVEPAPVVDPTLSSIQTNIFDKSCSTPGACHGGDSPKAVLSLEPGKSYQSLLFGKIQNDTALKYYRGRVVPNKPDSSFLCAKLMGMLRPDEGDRMPDRLNSIPQLYIDAVRQWIANGAKDN